MSVIKNGNEWCKLHSHQLTPEELQARLDVRFQHPLQRGLKRTRCDTLVLGQEHPKPLDAAPLCKNCKPQ